MSNIPTDIKNIINSTVFAPWYTDEGNIIFRKGAEFGYSLAIERIEGLEKEVERLKALVEKTHKGWHSTFYHTTTSITETQLEKHWNEAFEQFKKKNKL